MKTRQQAQHAAQKRSWPDARTTEENVKKGVMDESYVAVSPFDIDEEAVRRQLPPQRDAESGRRRKAPSRFPSR